MSSSSVAAELRKRLNTAFGDTYPIAWPNSAFLPPTLSDVDPCQWMRFTIREGDSHQISIGSPEKIWRHADILIIQLFDAPNKGDGPLKALGDAIADLFRAWSGQQVVCRAPSVRTVGEAEGWYQVNIIVPFIWDELK